MTSAKSLRWVTASAQWFREIEAGLAPYRRLLDLDTAHVWLYPQDRRERDRWLDPYTILAGAHGDPLKLIETSQTAASGVCKTLEEAAAAAENEGFHHWELVFPEVFYERGRERPNPGFDAVIGNPPWDRIKLQEVEFFAERRADIAQSQTAAERKRRIGALERAADPLWQDYLRAKHRAERLAAYSRRCGQYPHLSGGDMNLYALFTERALSLVNASGLVGFVTPSGIAADKEKSEFFGDLATSGRVAAVLDFENRKALFPDVHSSFKFCVFVTSGSGRTFEATDCASFLHSTADLADPERTFRLTPQDFLRVNPNTRTAPVFRTRRDAELTKRIYERLPVLVDRRETPASNPWGIRYFTMFHMTNDSGSFRVRPDLEAAGFYPVAGNRWKKGPEEYVPLYEGKMVQMYDHRAAAVVVNPDNIHRPGRPLPATEAQHQDPSWLPEPQFWVAEKETDVLRQAAITSMSSWLVFKDITAPTNQRTMIAAITGRVGLANTLPALVVNSGQRAALLLACLNSFALDFVARQKVQGQHLNPIHR